MDLRTICVFNQVIKKLRKFFYNLNFLEVHPQSRLSILAACEDPTTISDFVYQKQSWPLPQTGQMWLEHDLLTNPSVPGVFCLTTSYRNEANPVPGRHDLIFPMFEFESHGTQEDLIKLERRLCEFLGFGNAEGFKEIAYLDAIAKYNVDSMGNDEEERLMNDFGNVVFLRDFPEMTSPFWNMKRNDNGTSKKVDVIIHGIETIGSAERAIDKDEMKERFHTISDGMYATRLYNLFGKDRVEKELNDFLSFDFFERFGGGIGMTRLIRAAKLQKIY